MFTYGYFLAPVPARHPGHHPAAGGHWAAGHGPAGGRGGAVRHQGPHPRRQQEPVRVQPDQRGDGHLHSQAPPRGAVGLGADHRGRGAGRRLHHLRLLRPPQRAGALGSHQVLPDRGADTKEVITENISIFSFPSVMYTFNLD